MNHDLKMLTMMFKTAGEKRVLDSFVKVVG